MLHISEVRDYHRNTLLASCDLKCIGHSNRWNIEGEKNIKMIRKSRQAIEIFREDGFVPMSAKTTSYLYNRSRKMLIKRMIDRYFSDDRIILNNQLGNICSDIWYLEKEEEIKDMNPDGEGVPAEFSQYTLDPQPNRRFICEVPSCKLSGPSAVGFTNDGKLILETASGNKDYFTKRYLLFLGDISTKDLLFQTYLNTPQSDSDRSDYVFPLIPVNNRYYYHWMLEYLPKLRALEVYENHTDNEPTILLPTNPPSFVTDSLSLLGYTSDRWTEWQSAGQIVDNLLVTNHRHHSMICGFSPSLNDYYWLRKQMRSAISNRSQESGRKIYISRQQAEVGRKVVNYGEMIDEIESRGFESIVMEFLPLEKQIKLMMEADTIMGPHGAGLVNMIFSDDPTILELLPKNKLRAHFYMLSDLLEFEYNYLITEADDQSNLMVDIEKLSKILDEANV